MPYLLLFLPILLFSFSLDDILKQRKSHVRDFYLTEFMRDTNQTFLAYKAYQNLYRQKDYHKRLLAKKSKDFKKIYECEHLDKNTFLDYPIVCAKKGLSLRALSGFNSVKLQKVITGVPGSEIAKYAKILRTKQYSLIFKDTKTAYDFYTQYKHKKVLNRALPKGFLERYKTKRSFYTFLALVIRDTDLPIPQRSLLNIRKYKGMEDRSKFLLAINAIHHKHYTQARTILKSIKYKDNKVLFWLYLLTKDKQYAEELSKKNRIDFYTLYLSELTGKKFDIVTKVLSKSVEKVPYDVSDPYDILRYFDDLRESKDLFTFAKSLDHPKTEGLMAHALDKAHKFNKNYYITPPYELSGLTDNQKILLYALGKQESRFIPAQLSVSYAMGEMQIMPFLARAMSKKKHVYDFLNTKTNIKYAKDHLIWLCDQVKNPLFVSYAYNGGIGFTKRDVIPHFKWKGTYEPFLSMELIPYGESREYGKKVIANFIIYAKLFNKPYALKAFTANSWQCNTPKKSDKEATKGKK